MTLLLIAHPSAEEYGSDLQMLETVHAARENNWDVIVTLPTPGPLVDRLLEAGAGVVISSFPVLRKAYLSPLGLVRFGFSAFIAVIASRSAMRKVRPDVVLVNTLTLPTWLLASRLARIPVICHVHEAEDQVRPFMKRLLASPLLLARALIINSHAARKVLTDSVPSLAKRLYVVYNGIPDQPMRPLPPRERQSGDPAKLALVGRLSPRKGIDIALEAVALLLAQGRSVTLDVFGTPFAGYEWYASELDARSAEPDLAEAIRFRGYVNPTWGPLAEADVILVPSRVEPFGNTAVEALLAQRPLVASATQGLKEIVNHEQNGLLVPPDDPFALAQAIATLLDAPDRAASLAEAGRTDALERFSTAGYRREVMQIIAALAPDGESPPRINIQRGARHD